MQDSLRIAATVSTMLALSKAAWKIGSSLSKLDPNTSLLDPTVSILAREVKSLANECDLLRSKLDEVARQSLVESPSPEDIDTNTWRCLTLQVDECGRVMEELELLLDSIDPKSPGLVDESPLRRRLDNSMSQIASLRRRVRKQNDNLHTMSLIVTATSRNLAPGRSDQGISRELNNLRDMVQKLQESSEAIRLSRASDSEAALIRCARAAIERGTSTHEASIAAESIAGGERAATSNIRVAEWVTTLELIRREQRDSLPSDYISNSPSIFSGDGSHTLVTSATSVQAGAREREVVQASEDDSDDDLDTDLAKAALETGTKAFEAQDWEEADLLLQEALRLLHQLPKGRRAFCDVFGLQYKLAVCAYHTQDADGAEEALASLVQQPAISDDQREYVYDAAHLLSLLYIRMNQIDRARLECERSLQARRRLTGKQSDASLESTALMAHIYLLLDNRARAKACLAMIPEARKDAILATVGESLGTKVEHLLPLSGDLGSSVKRSQSSFTEGSLVLPMENRCYGPVAPTISAFPTSSSMVSQQRMSPESVDQQSVAVTSQSSRRQSRVTEREISNQNYAADLEVAANPAPRPAPSPGTGPNGGSSFNSRALSRKQILDKIGCLPRDRIEEAVCDGDHGTLNKLLTKKGFWRSKPKRRIRSERVTALHFAALFDEVDMARRLLDSGFDVNEVPFGYTTSQTPLKFAIGARQVNMVDFLTTHGARPSDPDTWSSLAAQLMNRSWLVKTLSEAEKQDTEYVPSRMIAILMILLKYGWDVNVAFEKSGRTVLHQAVAFWTGSYNWDLSLRAALTAFLCEAGADPYRADQQSKTPYDMASASGHQDLLQILDRATKREPMPAKPVELFDKAANMSPVEMAVHGQGW